MTPRRPAVRRPSAVPIGEDTLNRAWDTLDVPPHGSDGTPTRSGRPSLAANDALSGMTYAATATPAEGSTYCRSSVMMRIVLAVLPKPAGYVIRNCALTRAWVWIQSSPNSKPAAAA